LAAGWVPELLIDEREQLRRHLPVVKEQKFTAEYAERRRE